MDVNQFIVVSKNKKATSVELIWSPEMVDPRVKPFPWSKYASGSNGIRLHIAACRILFTDQTPISLASTFRWCNHTSVACRLFPPLVRWIVFSPWFTSIKCNSLFVRHPGTINPCASTALSLTTHTIKHLWLPTDHQLVLLSFLNSLLLSHWWSIKSPLISTRKIRTRTAQTISSVGARQGVRSQQRPRTSERPLRQSSSGFQVRCHSEGTARQELLSFRRETSHYSTHSAPNLPSMSRTRTSSSRMSTEASHRTTTARTLWRATKVGIIFRRDTLLISPLLMGNWTRFSRHSIINGTNVWLLSKADRRRRRTNKWRGSAKTWSVSLNSFINRTHSCRNNSACCSIRCNNCRANRQQSLMDIEQQNRVDESGECLDVDCCGGEITNKCRYNCDTEHSLRSLFNYVLINRKKRWNESLVCLLYCWDAAWILWLRRSLWNTCRRVWRKILPLSVWT